MSKGGLKPIGEIVQAESHPGPAANPSFRHREPMGSHPIGQDLPAPFAGGRSATHPASIATDHHYPNLSKLTRNWQGVAR